MALNNNNRDRQRTRVVFVPVTTGGGGGSQEDIKKFLNKEFSGKLELPIGAMDTPYCLYKQTGLTEVVVPEGATSIPNNFFQGCTSLEKITYPDSITSFRENIYGDIDIEKITSFPLPPYLNSSLDGNIYYRNGEIFNFPKYINEIDSWGNSSFVGSYNGGIAKRLNFQGNFWRFYYVSFRAEEVDFRYNVQIPTFYQDSIYTGMTKVIVPESLYDTWITTSPWSDYASITESVPDTDYFIPYQTKNGNDISLTTGVKENRYAVISYSDKKIHLRGTPWQMADIINSSDVTYVDFAASNLEVPAFSGLFRGCSSLTGFTLPPNKPFSCREMFNGCSSLTTVPEMDTSYVNDMYSMFYGCSSLTTIPQMDTSNVTTMQNMFQRCTQLTTIPSMDTSNVTTMQNMFQRCTQLTTIPSMNTSRVTNMQAMFGYCGALTSVPQMDTSNVTTMQSMFHSCTQLTTIPSMNTSRVTDMKYMFAYCNSLTSVPQMDTSKVTTMFYMFFNCSSLTTVPEMDTSKVTEMNDMFDACSLLSTVPEMMASNVTDASDMFSHCFSLTDLGGFIGLKCNLNLSDCSNLTHNSLMNVINKAADVTEAPKTLTLGSTNLAKLSDEEKAIATGKGWTLA